MTTPAEVIANNLAALPHPDGVPRQLPGFNTRLLPEVIQEQVTKTARDIADAIVHLLTMNGYTITTPDQIAKEPRDTRTAHVYCTTCTKEVLNLNITHPDRVLTKHHFALEPCPHA